MRIDYVTECRPATHLEKVAMDIYGQHQTYEILTCDGKSFSVSWNFKSLDEFLPNRVVSEVLKEWQNNFIRLIELYTECLKFNEHPHWTTTQHYYMPFFKEHTFERPQQMTKSQRQYYQSEIERLNIIKGELKFVAINNFEFKLNQPCSLYSNISMSDNVSNVTIIKEDDEFVYYCEPYDSYKHAPSQSLPKEGKMRKAEIGLAQYSNVTN